MRPPNPSDAHLADRILEFRVAKSLVVTFLLSVAAVFYGWAPVILVFALGYIAYRYRYYANRVGVYSSDDLSTRRDRLEYALLGLVGVAVAVAAATQVVFPTDEWTVGEFLSLPVVEFTNLDAVLANPVEAAAWGVVVAPVAVLSYVGMQFRERLLVGINTHQAAVRATLYDSLAVLPVALLWMAALTARPVYEVWRPAVDLVEDELGLDPSVTLVPVDTEGMALSELAVIFEDAFAPVAAVAIAAPVAVVVAYLVVQRWKYGNNTVPELLGYRGFLPPSRGFHELNAAVPVGVYLLYAVAVVASIGPGPVAEPLLFGAAGVAVAAGADVQGRTTATIRRLPGSVADGVDAVVAGLAVGLLAFVALAPVVGPVDALAGVALVYPVVAAPSTYAANRAVAYRTATAASGFGERVADNPEAFDRATVDRLFVYSGARDNRLRAAAVDALASAVQVDRYRTDDALAVFGTAVWSDDEPVVRAGLRGVAGVLDDDRSADTYDQLTADDVPSRVLALLDHTGETRLHAADVAARVLTAELDAAAASGPEQLAEGHATELCGIAADHPQRQRLVDAVVEYAARLYDEVSRHGSPEGKQPARQQLLGSLVGLSAHGSDRAALAAALAVTGGQTTADGDQFDQAVEAMSAERAETRYLATHVVRSSMDRHANRVDSDRLVARLQDSSGAVRSMAARALAALLRFAPERGPALLDPLVLALEEREGRSGRTAGVVLGVLADIDPSAVLDHPTAPSTVAAFVGDRYPAVARPAASLLTSLVEQSPALVGREPVGAGIEAGLVHNDSAVRLACLEAVAVVVEADTDAGQRFVSGLGANLGTGGRHGVLAAVTLRQVSNEHPDAALDILPTLADGLDNQTTIDNRTIPFVVRGETVSAVTADIIADAVSLDPGRGEGVIAPMVELVPTADASTRQSIFATLAALSSEFPGETTVAVDIAADGLEAGRTTIRRDAAQVLANVAAYHPDAVTPTVDALLVATDDTSPRVRAPALIALRNVCTSLPEAVESEVHRLVGSLDDDSATVREHAGRLVVTVAERQPAIVEPAAEAADRLRRLQRDPAVDIDPERLQDASTAIQTGVAPDADGEPASGDERAEIWSPETSDEMGVSGETNVFEPAGDEFEGGFDDEFQDAPAGSVPDEQTADDGSVADRSTVVDPDEPGDSGPEQPSGDSTGVGERDTVVQNDGTDGTNELGDHDTVIRGGDSSGETDDSGSDEDTGGLGEHDTVIRGGDASGETDDSGETDSGDDEDMGGLGEHDTVIRGGDSSGETDDSGETDSGDDEDTGGLGEHDTVIRGGDSSGETDDSGSDEDTGGLGEHDTVIRGGDSSGETDDSGETDS